jgi:PAS domain S-box-containing protein
VFLAEVFAMTVLLSFRTLPYYVQTLIDAGIMVVLIAPVIYLLSFRPLLLHIEKRRQAEQQVQEMALFPTLNPDAVLQVDASGQIVRTNPAGTKMGLSIGAQLSDLIPDLRDMELPIWIAEGKTQQIPQTQLGERVLQWVIHGAPELGLAFLYSTDVTEQKRAEAEIYRLSSIVQQTADTVVVTDHEGVIEYVNPAFEQKTGYRRDEVLGRTPRVLKSGVHDEKFYRELWETILSGENYQNEITNRSKSGALFHEVKTIMPLRDASGNITHFVATGKDITDRKEAEEKLKHAYDELELRVQQRTEELVAANISLQEEINERKRIQTALERSEQDLRSSEEKAQNLLKYAPAAIYEMDFYGQRFLSVNDIACQWTGYTREELFCLSPLSLVDEDSKTRFQERIKARLNGENSDEAVEYRIVAKDGHEIVAEMHVGAFTYKEGRPESVLVVAHDITGRKKAEQALQAANEELRRFNKAMVGRELRMIELKKEVNELHESAGKQPRYSLDFEKE